MSGYAAMGAARLFGAGRAGDGVGVLAAGSLQVPLRDGLAPLVDPPLRIEAHGSAAVARMVAGGLRDPDVVALADAALFDAVLSASWYRAFATNALVVAYDPATPGGRAVRDGDRWFAPVIDGRTSLGRTDPDRDPLGYRTLFMLRLAAARYDRPALPRRVLATDQVYPETELLAHFETGAIDAAVVYRSMAATRGYRYVDLPDAVDLSAPTYDDRYGRYSYTLPNGATVRGDTITYGATLRHDGAPARRVFGALTTGPYLARYGFGRPGRYPRDVGDVPDDLD